MLWDSRIFGCSDEKWSGHPAQPVAHSPSESCLWRRHNIEACSINKRWLPARVPGPAMQILAAFCSQNRRSNPHSNNITPPHLPLSCCHPTSTYLHQLLIPNVLGAARAARSRTQHAMPCCQRVSMLMMLLLRMVGMLMLVLMLVCVRVEWMRILLAGQSEHCKAAKRCHSCCRGSCCRPRRCGCTCCRCRCRRRGFWTTCSSYSACTGHCCGACGLTFGATDA